MSESNYEYEARRWLATAVDDLKAARVLAKGKMHAHACFNAQQSAEKALKAVWYFFARDPWGHSVQKLIQELPSTRKSAKLKKLSDKAAALDRFYIPTRDPNGLPDLTPSANYIEADATEALTKAKTILDACTGILG